MIFRVLEVKSISEYRLNVSLLTEAEKQHDGRLSNDVEAILLPVLGVFVVSYLGPEFRVR